MNWQSAPGKTSKKSFSVNKYGYEAALKMATEFRIKKEMELYGQVLE